MNFDATDLLRALIGACREWNRSDDPDARDAARRDVIESLEELLELARGGEDLPNPDRVHGHLDT
ncbi:MAG: hypothetical protein IPM29_02615 [Planctomycetes bacterium]|nr:hypothetical protein [Planctomycetota bacterium]